MGEKSNNTARGFVFIHNHFFTSLSSFYGWESCQTNIPSCDDSLGVPPFLINGGTLT